LKVRRRKGGGTFFGSSTLNKWTLQTAGKRGLGKKGGGRAEAFGGSLLRRGEKGEESRAAKPRLKVTEMEWFQGRKSGFRSGDFRKWDQ